MSSCDSTHLSSGGNAAGFGVGVAAIITATSMPGNIGDYRVPAREIIATTAAQPKSISTDHKIQATGLRGRLSAT
jgi:hypothetical protein